MFKIKIPSETPRSEEFRKEVGALASKIEVPNFVPNDEKAKAIQDSVNKEANKGEEGKEEEKKEEEEEKFDVNDIELMLGKFKKILEELPKSSKAFSDWLLTPEEFEKDNDVNHHIDFISAMANCRALNYKLEPMDWLTVKLKAGRIVPALATTTAAIAGLQTLELIKLVKKCKKVDHRNIFLNLAVPIMQASEPGDLMKTTLVEGVEVNLWDRWDVKIGKDPKLIDVIKYVEGTYKGLEVRDVMKGNAPIYFHAIMGAPGKEKEKEKTMKSKVSDLVGADLDEKYTLLNITCIKKEDPEEKILAGVPPV